jgi:ribonuclease VapC
MIIDTSALIAILRDEPEAAACAEAIQLVIEAVTEVQARIPREAYRDFGRGSGHPTRLNFGDCFAYALARPTGEPLRFKGDDFVRTDIAPALPVTPYNPPP